MELQNGTRTCLPIAPLAVPQLREALGFRSAKRRAEHGRCRPARIAAREARPRWRVATRAAEAEREAVAARREENGSGRQLVVAVDDSEESEKALKWTVDNFYRSGDVIHILHVLPFLPGHAASGAVYYSPPPTDDLQKQMEEDAQQFIGDRFVPLLDSLDVAYHVDVIQEESFETIGEAVCHSAVDLDAAAIVVAAHRKSTLAKFISGSSSREVAGKSDLPVLVFHG